MERRAELGVQVSCNDFLGIATAAKVETVPKPEPAPYAPSCDGSCAQPSCIDRTHRSIDNQLHRVVAPDLAEDAADNEALFSLKARIGWSCARTGQTAP